ncbi:hypothetical protein Tco_0299133 [Tanacetum coccineum]
MPVELGSFDAIIGMDWLAKYQAIIVCVPKSHSDPLRKKHVWSWGRNSNQGHEARLHIISQVEEEAIEDCTNSSRIFPEVFPGGTCGSSSDSTSGFPIDFGTWCCTVARAPYRLAPSEMKELSEHTKYYLTKALQDLVSSPGRASLRSCLSRRRDGSSGCALIIEN